MKLSELYPSFIQDIAIGWFVQFQQWIVERLLVWYYYNIDELGGIRDGGWIEWNIWVSGNLGYSDYNYFVVADSNFNA